MSISAYSSLINGLIWGSEGVSGSDFKEHVDMNWRRRSAKNASGSGRLLARLQTSTLLTDRGSSKLLLLKLGWSGGGLEGFEGTMPLLAAIVEEPSMDRRR